MDDHGKPEIGWYAIGNVTPVFATVIRSIQAPMVLQKEPFGTIGMHDNFVHALSELWVLDWHEHYTDALVLGCPVNPTIVRAVNPTG
jgi:hypothetical protein